MSLLISTLQVMWLLPPPLRVNSIIQKLSLSGSFSCTPFKLSFLSLHSISHSHTKSEHIPKWFLIPRKGHTFKHVDTWCFLLFLTLPRVTYSHPTNFFRRSLHCFYQALLWIAIYVLNGLRSGIVRSPSLQSYIPNIPFKTLLIFVFFNSNKQKKPECMSKIMKK